MSTMKYLLFGALGVAAVVLLTSDKARDMRKDLEELAKDNADKWKDKFKSMGSNAGKRLTELRELLSTEVEGLSDDARTRIQNILNGATNGVKKMDSSMA